MAVILSKRHANQIPCADGRQKYGEQKHERQAKMAEREHCAGQLTGPPSGGRIEEPLGCWVDGSTGGD